MIRSTPELYATAHGSTCRGAERCFFCSAACETDLDARRFVKESFTGRSSVACPSSRFVCRGCELGFRDAADFDQIDGSRRSVAKNAIRSFSWIVTRDRALAASPAHMDAIRAVCLEPPEPPYSIVLSVAAKAHLLYRGVVVRDDRAAGVTLEGEPIRYRPDELESRLALAGRICAAIGKPGLQVAVNSTTALKVISRRPDGAGDLDSWISIQKQPLSRLASWVCPIKENCERDHPAQA